MKWGKISKAVWQAQNDIIDICNMKPSDRHSEEESDNTELDQWSIDQFYNLLESAAVNIKTAMDKLRPHTTYYKKGKQ